MIYEIFNLNVVLINIFMLTKTSYEIWESLVQNLLNSLPTDEFKHTINSPTGRFFYDPWVIRPGFKDTPWERLLTTLPFAVGETRIIILNAGTAYRAHADIDDRYHLNLQSEFSYLIDLENNELHKIECDKFWYEMDAGRLHTAANFGRSRRIQIVARKLLTENKLILPINVRVGSPSHNEHESRFIFDSIMSPWLNRANKNKLIGNFRFLNNEVMFEIEKNQLENLKNILPRGFEIYVE